MSGITGCASTLTGMPASVSVRDGRQAQCGTGRERLQQTGQALIERGDGQCTRILFLRAIRAMSAASRATRSDLVVMPISSPRSSGEGLQHLASDVETPLGRLIGIGGRADPDRVAGLEPPKFGPKRGGHKLFCINLALEQLRIAQFHELMRVAGVAILATELAAAIGIQGIDGPHAARTAADEAPSFEFEVFHLTLGFEHVAGSGQARDADKFGGEDRRRTAWGFRR